MANKFIKKIIGLGIVGALVLGAVVVAPMTLTNVKAGEYKIVQSIGGKNNVLDTPGFKFTGFRTDSTRYSVGDTMYFSNSDLDGGDSPETLAIPVIFRDGSKGDINGNIQFRLPVSKEQRMNLHTMFGRDYKKVLHNLIRKSVAESVIQSSTYYKGEEAYTYGRSEFVTLIQKQLEQGIYATIKEQRVIKDAEGNEFMDNIVKVKTDKDGNPIIQKESRFETYGIDIVGFNVEGIILDSETMAYIKKKKEAEFDKIQKQAEAEQAKQEAITAKAKGDAMIAQAKAQAEVTKQKSVTKAEETKAVATLRAEQDRDVAKLAKEKSILDSEALLIQKEADAKANALLVKAGLTPLQKAQIDKDTRIGVARELAKVNVPKIVMSGTTGSSSANPMDALGVKMLLDIESKLSR